jgi:hypothetical protein
VTAADLSPAQWKTLVLVEALDEGYPASFRNPSLCWLQRHNLAEVRGAAAASRKHRWFVTIFGRELVETFHRDADWNFSSENRHSSSTVTKAGA